MAWQLLVSHRAHEELTTRTLSDGQWHAHYPTAARTLCTTRLPAVAMIGRRRSPSCEECVRVARLFNAIDGSAPKHWGWRVTIGDRRKLERQLAA